MADTHKDGIDISGRAWAKLVLLSVIWDGTYFAAALRKIGPVTAVPHRVGWATLLLWLVVWTRGMRRTRYRRAGQNEARVCTRAPMD